jgi:hypothetical protein
MTIAEWCLFGAVILYLGSVAPVKALGRREAFLITRVAYVLAYVGNKPTLRTVLWNAAFAFNLGIFFLSGTGVRGAMIATAAGLLWALAVWPILAQVQRTRTRAPAANEQRDADHVR